MSTLTSPSERPAPRRSPRFRFDRAFSVGEVLSRSLSILISNFVPFLIICFVIHLPAFICFLNLEVFVPRPTTLEEWNSYRNRVWTFVVAANVLDMLLGMIATSALVYGVVQQLRGKRATILASLAQGFRHLGRTLIVGLAVIALVAAGLLLIVPGLMLLCAFWVAIPVAVVEGGGVRHCLRRSAELTRGSRWTIFGIFLVTILLAGLVHFAVGMLTSAFAAGPLVELILSIVLGTAFGALGSTASAVGYHALRVDREQVDIDEIASVFN